MFTGEKLKKLKIKLEIENNFNRYLRKVMTLSMNVFRVSAVDDMLEYFPEPSFHPPIAIVTFRFGCFCLKLIIFLYCAIGNSQQFKIKIKLFSKHVKSE